jgi:uncharacterized protein YhbP (UPF0306 family)
MKDDTLRARILGVLQSQQLMTLATLRADGYPQASILNYIADDFTVYFATDAASQKVANIAFNNKVSVAIAVETEDFYKLSGLSMTGVARRILEKEVADEYSLRLFRRLPQSKRFVPADTQQLALFAVTPVVISLIDYAAGFGTTYLFEPD